MNLYKLAKLILTIERKGISKVRLAKTIYFVHKELIRSNAAKPSDLGYVRMPLGPVPDGFMQLTQQHSDIVTVLQPTGLSYNATVYKMKRLPIFKFKDGGYKTVEKILSGLRNVPTSKLVEISHEEPSWIYHENGERFHISKNDLAISFPQINNNNVRFDEAIEAQSLQASLVSGMLRDIVEESTALEFPDDGRQQAVLPRKRSSK